MEYSYNIFNVSYNILNTPIIFWMKYFYNTLNETLQQNKKWNAPKIFERIFLKTIPNITGLKKSNWNVLALKIRDIKIFIAYEISLEIPSQSSQKIFQ